MNHSDWTGFARTVISIAVAVAAAPALAQNTTSAVSGVVTGADGRPVAGATVQIVHRDSGVGTSVTTGADGRYAARGLRVGGPYTITVTKDGRSDKRDEVYLALASDLAAEDDARLVTRALARLTALDPLAPGLQLALGTAALRSAELDLAMAAAETAALDDPGWPEPQLLMARALASSST